MMLFVELQIKITIKSNRWVRLNCIYLEENIIAHCTMDLGSVKVLSHYIYDTRTNNMKRLSTLTSNSCIKSYSYTPNNASQIA